MRQVGTKILFSLMMLVTDFIPIVVFIDFFL